MVVHLYIYNAQRTTGLTILLREPPELTPRRRHEDRSRSLKHDFSRAKFPLWHASRRCCSYSNQLYSKRCIAISSFPAIPRAALDFPPSTIPPLILSSFFPQIPQHTSVNIYSHLTPSHTLNPSQSLLHNPQPKLRIRNEKQTVALLGDSVIPRTQWAKNTGKPGGYHQRY